MSRKSKALGMVTLLFIALAAIYTTVELKRYNADIQWAIEREEESLDTVITLLEKHYLNPFVSRLRSISDSEEIIAAFAQRDRKLLYSLALPRFLEFKVESDADLNMHFHLPDGTSFLRMHLPEKFGEDLSEVRPAIIRMHEIRSPYTTYEIGRRGCYFRIVEPVFYNEEYIGAFEVGIPVTTFADEIKKQLNVETALFFESSQWQKVQYKQYTTLELGRFTILFPEKCRFSLPLQTDLLKDTHTYVTYRDKTCIAHSLPIFTDYQGNIIGGIIAGQDITPFIDRKNNHLRSMLMALLALSVVFMVVLYFTLGRLMDSIGIYHNRQDEIMDSLHQEIAERKKSEQERSLLQAQLLQSQKMEALGLLSGGIAHDFNNLLTSILGYTQLLLLNRALDETSKSHLHSIASAGEKAASLIKQLLAFSRTKPVAMKQINLGIIIENLSRIINRLIGDDIDMVLDIDKDGAVIQGDQTQIEQIVLNLAVNARDAMPRGGILTIRVKREILEEAQQCSFSDLPPGTYVMLDIVDTGFGILPEIQDKIFDPFFTTKPEGKGTGLGLSTVYGIVTQHNGHICMTSEAGRGTAFSVAFPACQRRKGEQETCLITDMLPRGDETILVVDDEPAILTVVEDILQSLGYTTLLAKDGREAVDIFAREKDRISLVLTDLVMPGMNGHELILELCRIKPGSRVIMMSGYSDEILSRYVADMEQVRLLHKPLSINEVARIIRTALDT